MGLGNKQSFAVHDIAVVLVLIGMEALLSMDNCVVLTVLVQHLAERERRRALFYGLGGAFLFRLIFVVLATTLMSYWWLQAMGAGYLFYITLKHFLGYGSENAKSAPRSLLRTIIAVELTDVCFAGDSVMAGVALVKGAPEKLWSVYLGGVLGILSLRYAISVLSKLVDRWPRLVDLGYVFVAWVGTRLLLVGLNKLTETGTGLVVPSMSDSIFWVGMALIAIVGSIVVRRSGSGPTQASKMGKITS